MVESISARKEASNVIVAKGPDVCWTPRGGSMVKVPYSSVAHLETAIRISKSVRNNGNYDFQINSRCSCSTGNEPGTGKGVVVPGYCGMALAEKGAHFTYSEGWSSVGHRAPAWINRPDPGPVEQQKPTLSTKIALPSSQGGSQSGSQGAITGSIAAPMQADHFEQIDAKAIPGDRQAKTTSNATARVVVQAAAPPLAPHPDRPPYNYDKLVPPKNQIGPTIHDMDNPGWDIEPTPHRYSIPDTDPSAKICSHAILACNVTNVKSSVMRTQVPGQQGAVQDQDLVTVKAMGMTAGTVRVIDDGSSVTNETLPGHIFYYGYVTRRIVDKPDGIYLSVEGGGMNKSAAIAQFNEVIGPTAFKLQNNMTRQDFNSHFNPGSDASPAPLMGP